MNGLGRFRLVAVAGVLAVAACERPTAPELVAKIDRAERDMLADTSERALGWRLGASWDLIRLLPNGRVGPNLLTDIDGKEHWFKAFVFERVVIRLDPHDGYPCPLVLRELLAVEGGRQSFMLKGSISASLSAAIPIVRDISRTSEPRSRRGDRYCGWSVLATDLRSGRFPAARASMRPARPTTAASSRLIVAFRSRSTASSGITLCSYPLSSGFRRKIRFTDASHRSSYSTFPISVCPDFAS